jgi:hypothetical protein
MKQNKIRKIALAVLELLKDAIMQNSGHFPNENKYPTTGMMQDGKIPKQPPKASGLQFNHRGVPIIPLNGQTIFKQGADAVQGKQLNMVVDRIVTPTGNSLDGIPVPQGASDL